MVRKKIYLIIAAIIIGAGASYVVYNEGTRNDIIDTPTIPRAEAPNTTPQTQVVGETITQPLTEEEKKKEDEKKAEEEKKKKEQEEKEIADTYSKTPDYQYGGSISAYTYTANSIQELEEKLRDRINYVNESTTEDIEKVIASNTATVADKLNVMQQQIADSKAKAEEALRKAEESLKQQEKQEEQNKVDDSTTTSKSTRVTLSNSDIAGIYTGEIIDGKAVGKGTFTRSDGNKNVMWVYDGTFENGTLKTGTMIYADGTTLTGSFSAGKLNGNAEIITNTFLYKGTVESGRISGKGTISYVTGESYTGSFKNGRDDGYGEYTKNDDSVIKGIFDNGVIVEKEEA